MESVANNASGYPRGPFISSIFLKDDDLILREGAYIMNSVNQASNLSSIRSPVLWRQAACSVLEPSDVSLYNLWYSVLGSHLRNPAAGKKNQINFFSHTHSIMMMMRDKCAGMAIFYYLQLT